ncbi:MAG: glycosyltransferase family 1 protein [Anaerolineae bacterium]|nr:glycosyltransferase family 1 protein [Anaerolineae bacterium]
MPTGLKYISLGEHSGYGEAARAYLQGLFHAGLDLTWTPLVWDDPRGYTPLQRRRGLPGLVHIPRQNSKSAWRIPPAAQHFFSSAQDTFDFWPLIYNQIEYDTVIMHTVPEYWPWLLRPGKLNIGMTVWETTLIPPHWQELLQLPDQLMVPSEFVREIFRQNGITRPIEVIPHISLPPGPPPSSERVARFRLDHQIPSDRFLFYTINTWNSRKALWHTLRAYLETFTCHDPVALIVKTSPRGPRDCQADTTTPTDLLVQEILAAYPEPAPVCCISQEITQAQMHILHHIGDSYVSLTHSEGWGLGAFEAAARGKPVIMTGWGGHLEYLRPENSFLVDYDLIPVQDRLGGESYQPNQQWAQPNLQAAGRWMRWVYEHPQQARRKAEALEKDIQDRFQEAVVTEKILTALAHA